MMTTGRAPCKGLCRAKMVGPVVGSRRGVFGREGPAGEAVGAYGASTATPTVMWAPVRAPSA